MSLNEPPPPARAPHGATPQAHDGRVIVTPAKPSKLLRLDVVMDRVGLGRSSIYAGVKNRTFVIPVRLSARAVAWREDEIDRWVSERARVGTPS
jgi:prophage regulatory protein